MRIQFVSDLHIEWVPRTGNLLYIKPRGDILILAGDIVPGSDMRDLARFRLFLAHYSESFAHIVHVPGNHEYWSGEQRHEAVTMPAINAAFLQLERDFPKYKYVPRGTLRFWHKKKKYVLICSTLWSEIPPAEHAAIKGRMHDYDMIWLKTASGIRKLEPRDVSRMHHAHRKFIAGEIAKTAATDTVILVTHHKPTVDLGKGVAYETDLVGSEIGPPVKLAIHGHTHVLYDKVVNDTRVVSNPKGYHGVQRTGFRPDWTINV